MFVRILSLYCHKLMRKTEEHKGQRHFDHC